MQPLVSWCQTSAWNIRHWIKRSSFSPLNEVLPQIWRQQLDFILGAAVWCRGRKVWGASKWRKQEHSLVNTKGYNTHSYVYKPNPQRPLTDQSRNQIFDSIIPVSIQNAFLIYICTKCSSPALPSLCLVFWLLLVLPLASWTTAAPALLPTLSSSSLLSTVSVWSSVTSRLQDATLLALATGAAWLFAASATARLSQTGC